MENLIQSASTLSYGICAVDFMDIDFVQYKALYQLKAIGTLIYQLERKFSEVYTHKKPEAVNTAVTTLN